MKTITRVLMAIFLTIGLSAYSMPASAASDAKNFQAEELFNYSFSLEGVPTYMEAKPLYRFVQDTFLKRPSFNDATGKFEITGSPILISLEELINRFNQINMVVTSFELINSTNSNNNQETR